MKKKLRTAAALGAVAAAAVGASVMGFAIDDSGAGAALAVREASGWLEWWRRDSAPASWSGAAPLAGHVKWRQAAPGLDLGELELRGASEAWRTRVVIVRLDPRRIEVGLAPAFLEQRDWSVDEAGSDISLALDAGQFRQSLPWGWVVSGGQEVLAPQYAPLAGAVVVDSAGAVRVIGPGSVEAERQRGTVREAFQSYPMLLENGRVPQPLRLAGSGVDLDHRDGRLALGTLDDGRVLIALTRFDALGARLGRVPFGLTSPEMAAIMGALGCRQAILLDGGISGQLMVRESGGAPHVWPGTRKVPLGLVGRIRR